MGKKTRIHILRRHRFTLKIKSSLLVGGIVAATLIVLFTWFLRRSEQDILDRVDAQARSLLQQIVIMRQWIADQNGLYVRKAPGIATNPYLPGTDIRDVEGRHYALRNPAMATRQLSEYSDKSGQYRFRITSLKLRNPANAPNVFERESLLAFETEGFEKTMDGIGRMDHENGRPVYRRIVPLRVESSCLRCHQDQGYRVGDIRGGISVTIPVDGVLQSIRRNRFTLIVLGTVIMSVVLGSLYFIVSRLMLKPVSHLLRVAENIDAGRYESRAHLVTGDELEDLAHAINHMTDRIRTGYVSGFKALAAAIDARDPYTRGHIDRVAKYTFAIAREMGWPEEKINEWKMGVVLHDVGKLGISDAVLQKSGELDEAEWEEMQSHPRKGADIVIASDLLILELPAILYHHERWDGTGYPAGLKGEAIPVIARIIAVADVYDALTTDRPYRKALTSGMAVNMIMNEAESHFDPQVVKAFMRACLSGFGDRESSAEFAGDRNNAMEVA